MSNGNTKRRCSCYHLQRSHLDEAGPCRLLCDCRRFDLAAVRLPSGLWMTATEDGPVCGAQFPGVTYRCGLSPHEVGRCHALDTTLEWHRQPVEPPVLDREGLKALARTLLGRDEAVAS